MKRSAVLVCVLFTASVLSGCSLFAQATPTSLPLPSSTPVICPVEIPLPTMEATMPALAPTPAPTATPSPVMTIEADIAFDNYLLRSGPGRLFERLGMYNAGETVNIIGREAGNNWVMVQTGDHYAGWMNIVGLSYMGDIITLPVFEVNDAQILRGHVWNVDKTPAALIGIGLQPAGNTDPNLQEQVSTSEDGAWYAYLPVNLTGDWQVGPNSYGCPANVPTGHCSLTGTFPAPQTVTLPMAGNINIEFNIQP
jgi:hypothetical protein